MSPQATIAFSLSTTSPVIKWVFNLWARLHPYVTEWVEDLPDEPNENTIYIIGGRQYPFYAAIACPRRSCKHIIHLDLSPQVKRRWRFVEHGGGEITLTPSIHVTGLPCRCHFWMVRSRIVWSERPPLVVPEANRHD